MKVNSVPPAGREPMSTGKKVAIAAGTIATAAVVIAGVAAHKGGITKDILTKNVDLVKDALNKESQTKLTKELITKKAGTLLNAVKAGGKEIFESAKTKTSGLADGAKDLLAKGKEAVKGLFEKGAEAAKDVQA